MRHAVLTLLLAMPASAETTHGWGMLEGYTSTIVLQPTDAPGAVAQVTFDNKTVHVDENVTFALTLDGLTVEVYAQVGRGLTPDRMTVEAPDGYIAIPASLDVAEDDIGVILLYRYLGF